MRGDEFTLQVTGGCADAVQQLWQWIDSRPDMTGGYKQLHPDSSVVSEPECYISANVYTVNECAEMFVSGVVCGCPILDLLRLISEMFSTLKGAIRLSLGDNTGSTYNEYLFGLGQYTNRPKQHRGYYHTTNDDGFDDGNEPILAYELQFAADGSQDAVIQQMFADGMFLDAIDPSNTLTRDADFARSSNSWGWRAWTVAETHYLGALQTIADVDRVDRPWLSHHVRELYDAVCRDIALTPDEIKQLYDTCGYNRPWCLGESSGAILTRLEVGCIERGHLTGGQLYPTAGMLRHLADLTTDEARSSQLRDAIRNPRWAAPDFDWPIWRLKRQYRQQWETDLPPFDVDGFIAEVRAIKTD